MPRVVSFNIYLNLWFRLENVHIPYLTPIKAQADTFSKSKRIWRRVCIYGWNINDLIIFQVSLRTLLVVPYNWLIFIIINHFSGFFEERALLLGRLGKHEQALAIYAHVLKDTRRAEDYCRRNYTIDREGNIDVSSYLCTCIKRHPASWRLL